MQKKFFQFSLCFLSLIVAFFAWRSLSIAVTVPNSSVWLVPIIWFSLLYTTYSLQFVIVSEKLWVTLSIFLGIFLSLIFAPNGWHFLFLLLTSVMLYFAYAQIRNDLSLNVKINFPKTLRTGKAFFMLALAMAISSQYYAQVKNTGLLKLPTLEAGVILENKLVKEALYKINPDLEKLESKDLTVDELILENLKDSQMESGEAEIMRTVSSGQLISPDNLQKIEKIKEQKILESGREQLGKMVGRKLTGSEKVATVLAESLDQKIQSFVSPDYSKGGFPIVPIVMASILFLTVLSLVAFIARILVHFVGFIFWLCIVAGIISIKKIPVEMEVIE